MKPKSRYYTLLLLMLLVVSGGCDMKPIDRKTSGTTYVKPSIDRRGRYRKGHVRNSVSLKRNAYKSQAKSRYYYQTRGKYRRKKS